MHVSISPFCTQFRTHIFNWKVLLFVSALFFFSFKILNIENNISISLFVRWTYRRRMLASEMKSSITMQRQHRSHGPRRIHKTSKWVPTFSFGGDHFRLKITLNTSFIYIYFCLLIFFLVFFFSFISFGHFFFFHSICVQNFAILCIFDIQTVRLFSIIFFII